MQYNWIAIDDADVPSATVPLLQHLVNTYVSETNKTASMWKAIPDSLLDYRPHEKCNPIRTILVHQLLSERRFFAQFVGLQEPPVDQLLPPGAPPGAGLHGQICLARQASLVATRSGSARVVGRRN